MLKPFEANLNEVDQMKMPGHLSEIVKTNKKYVEERKLLQIKADQLFKSSEISGCEAEE